VANRYAWSYGPPPKRLSSSWKTSGWDSPKKGKKKKREVIRVEYRK